MADIDVTNRTPYILLVQKMAGMSLRGVFAAVLVSVACCVAQVPAGTFPYYSVQTVFGSQKLWTINGQYGAFQGAQWTSATATVGACGTGTRSIRGSPSVPFHMPSSNFGLFAGTGCALNASQTCASVCAATAGCTYYTVYKQGCLIPNSGSPVTATANICFTFRCSLCFSCPRVALESSRWIASSPIICACVGSAVGNGFDSSPVNPPSPVCAISGKINGGASPVCASIDLLGTDTGNSPRI